MQCCTKQWLRTLRSASVTQSVLKVSSLPHCKYLSARDKFSNSLWHVYKYNCALFPLEITNLYPCIIAYKLSPRSLGSWVVLNIAYGLDILFSDFHSSHCSLLIFTANESSPAEVWKSSSLLPYFHAGLRP